MAAVHVNIVFARYLYCMYCTGPPAFGSGTFSHGISGCRMTLDGDTVRETLSAKLELK